MQVSMPAKLKRTFPRAAVWQLRDAGEGNVGVYPKYDQGSSEAHTQPRRSCHTPGTDNIPDNLAMDGARDTVLQLQVHLGDGVLREDGGIRDITWWGVSIGLGARADGSGTYE